MGGRGSIFKSHNKDRKGAAKLRVLDYGERYGFVKGVVKDIVHDPGRGAPLIKANFHNARTYKLDKELYPAVEGSYTGQFIYCGKKAQLIVGNTLPVMSMPEGAVICNVETRPGDRGDCSLLWRLLHHHRSRCGEGPYQDPSAFWLQEVGAATLPCHHRYRGWWRSPRQAYAEGWSCLPQVQGEAQLLAKGSWVCHEPSRAPSRRW